MKNKRRSHITKFLLRLDRRCHRFPFPFKTQFPFWQQSRQKHIQEIQKQRTPSCKKRLS
jgi:hypothetical protein